MMKNCVMYEIKNGKRKRRVKIMKNRIWKNFKRKFEKIKKTNKKRIV